MTGWNLPPGCTQRDIDEAAGAFDEPPPPTGAEQLAEELHEAQRVIETVLDMLCQGRPERLIAARVHLTAYLNRGRRDEQCDA